MGLFTSKLQTLEARHQELEKLLCDPAVLADSNLVREYSRERASLSEAVSKFGEYRKVEAELEETARLLSGESDADFRSYLESERKSLEEKLRELNKEIAVLLLPKDPNEGKSVLVEIRAGTGGEEAALFAGDLFRMYTRYAERQGWKVELLNLNPTGLGGMKEAVFGVQGKEAWGRLKFESGVHRIQRVPATEAGGRIHTSTATVAVLPEVEDFEVEIKPADLKMDTFRASGAGGQYVNKTESAVRITHLPTGFVVACQDERSQKQNRDKAMRILRAHLYEMMQQKQVEEQGKLRKSQVGTGERSEKIRTYNIPQSRITDHRANVSVHNIAEVLDGELDDLMGDLKAWEEEENLKAVT